MDAAKIVLEHLTGKARLAAHRDDMSPVDALRSFFDDARGDAAAAVALRDAIVDALETAGAIGRGYAIFAAHCFDLSPTQTARVWRFFAERRELFEKIPMPEGVSFELPDQAWEIHRVAARHPHASAEIARSIRERASDPTFGGVLLPDLVRHDRAWALEHARELATSTERVFRMICGAHEHGRADLASVGDLLAAIGDAVVPMREALAQQLSGGLDKRDVPLVLALLR